PHDTELYADVPRTRLPIVYHPGYTSTFLGNRKASPLRQEQFVSDENLVTALEATEQDLLVVHTKRYLSRLKWSAVVAGVTEMPPIMFLPNFLVQRRVLRPLRTQTGGTIMVGL
ncbi:hypothetical protein CRUP_006037, partial [Coryphaenoides rupestris]